MTLPLIFLLASIRRGVGDLEEEEEEEAEEGREEREIFCPVMLEAQKREEEDDDEEEGIREEAIIAIAIGAPLCTHSALFSLSLRN